MKNVNSLHSSFFSGRVVLVTGAAHGIGSAICCAFLRHGANVIGTDIQDEILADLNSKINKSLASENKQNQFDTFQCDITNEEQVNKLIEYIIDKYKRVDILVNNAGGVCGQVNKPIEEVTEEEWRKIVNVNLDGTFFTTKAAAPQMKKQNYGRIINISSGAGRSTSLTGIQAYASAKAGQIGFTRQMAQELGPFGITVNNIAPGFVLSNPSSRKQWNRMTKMEQDTFIRSVSLKRLGEPEDIANAVLFFSSDFASYISGQTISVDGGEQLF